jgi:hypothetical protein
MVQVLVYCTTSRHVNIEYDTTTLLLASRGWSVNETKFDKHCPCINILQHEFSKSMVQGISRALSMLGAETSTRERICDPHGRKLMQNEEHI